MFLSKAGAHPSEAYFRRSTLGRLLTLPTNIKLGRERPDRDKHSSFLYKFVNYSLKKFCNNGALVSML